MSLAFGSLRGTGRYALDDGLRERIRANLDAFAVRPQGHGGLRRAAVAVALVADAEGAAAFVLTERTDHLRGHSGQWALPGGRLDDDETPQRAALRELAEETGLALTPGRVLGVLDDYATRSGYLITPVVVWGGAGARLKPNPAEVKEMVRVPISELDRPDSPELLRIPESDRPVIRMRIGDDAIHAPAGAVLYQFREVGLHGREARVDGYEQPVWAWQ